MICYLCMRKGVLRALTSITRPSTSSPTTANINKGDSRILKGAAGEIISAFSWTVTKLTEATHTAILNHQLFKWRWNLVQTKWIVSKRPSLTRIKGDNQIRTYPRCSKNKNSSQLQMLTIASTNVRTSWATKPSLKQYSTIWNSVNAKTNMKRKLA